LYWFLVASEQSHSRAFDAVLTVVLGEPFVRRSDRLFDIVQALRGKIQPTTAAALAQQLGVTPRTIYRDIATLQARRIPIEGEPGVGYLLRKGFDLPPLTFTVEEVEAIALGADLLHRIRDAKLQEAAESVLNKVQHTVTKELYSYLAAPQVFWPESDMAPTAGIELLDVRNAIRTCRKISISYIDDRKRRSRRTIWPIATVYHADATLIVAWCELHGGYRNFRVDRIVQSEMLEDRFAADSSSMILEWMANRSQE
jgi:predicted DNA-binding transcriptional regulator YafY